MSIGPLHILVFGFDHPRFTGAAFEELRRLEGDDLVRLVDLIFVEKDDDGTVVALEVEDLDAEQAAVLGDLAGALVGLDGASDGADQLDDDLWDIASDIPPGTAAAVVLLEHRWAVGLSRAIAAAGGQLVGDALVPAADLALLGEEFESAVHARVS